MIEQKCGIVTGGSSGIGQATVQRLVAEGYNVVALDLQPQNPPAAIDCPNGASVVSLVGDVVDPASAEACIATLSERGWSLDFLVNVAGVSLTFGPLHETHPDVFAKTQAINLTGTFNMYRAVARAMIAAERRGSIVNIASIAAFRPVPGAGSYCASKAGVVALTQVAALELAKHGIRVNAVCPGATDTPLLTAALGGGTISQLAGSIPLGEVVKPAMVADAVAWLISDGAAYITGVALPVDGGSQLL